MNESILVVKKPLLIINYVVSTSKLILPKSRSGLGRLLSLTRSDKAKVQFKINESTISSVTFINENVKEHGRD